MQRSVLYLATLLTLAVLGCSENPNAVKTVSGNAADVTTPAGSLDQNVLKILALYPKGLEQAATTRWSNVKAKAAAGRTDPAAAKVAKSMLVELTDWIVKKTPEMETPPDNEPKAAASARAVLYMSMYVYGGSATLPPPYSPSADVAIGIVTPSAPATIVTPTKHAGVQFEAGSVDENTIIVVSQNPAPFPDNCSGPLQTRLCQYPQFYTFEQFPHKALLKPAKFNVCHINSGDSRRPLADHDRFRLAHAKPANPADYTPGSIIRDQNGESIEILPLVPQTFSTCEDNAYVTVASAGGVLGTISRLANGVRKIFSPKTAYAIDLGLGGLSRYMSPFNDVDPLGVPDLAIDSIVVGEAAVVHPGDHLSMTLFVSNLGTATQSTVGGVVYLTSPPPVVIEGPPQPAVDRQVASIVLPTLVARTGQTINNVDIPIPVDVGSGTYQVKVVVGNDPVLSDANPVNNVAIRSVSLDADIVNLGTLPGDEGSVGMAINDAGHAAGYSYSTSISRPILWVNGTMTFLGTLGGQRAWAQGINNNDEIVGYSELATGGFRAFLWKNGTMTNLGTLPGTNASVAVDINASGQIAGYSYNQATGIANSSIPWIWQNGVMTALALPAGYSAAYAFAINDVGQIVGAAFTQAGAVGAWISQNGVTSIVNTQERQAEAIGLNDQGSVVGDVFSDNVAHAFITADGFTDLGVLGSDEGAEAHAISNDGTIVGLSYARASSNQYNFHAVMWRNGQAVQLGTLGGNVGWPMGLNELNQVVGYSSTVDNKNRATIWNIAPPPVFR